VHSQAGTLDLLITLSEDIPKQDAFFTATVAKTVDTLRNLLNNDPSKLVQHLLVNEKSTDDYILNGWKWNEGRYGVEKGLRDMVDVLSKVRPFDFHDEPVFDTAKEMNSIDSNMKVKLNDYNLVKGSLTQMQRKNAYDLISFVQNAYLMNLLQWKSLRAIARRCGVEG
jgi:V-type H+-transporting ATPase subunit C